MSGKIGFDILQKEIVSEKICSGCGACYLVCPYPNILDYIDGKPVEVGECKECGICIRICPRYQTSLQDLTEFVFGRKKETNEELGIYKNIHIVKSTDKEILRKGQDGGVVTTILTSALDEGLIDGAIISGVDKITPLLPNPQLATNRDEIVSNAGTRYTYSPGLLVIKEVLSKKLGKIAFVGTPCQIWSLRNIQKIPLRKYSKPITLSIGLFCSESFSYNGLMVEKIQKGMDIDLNKISKVNIKGGLLIQLKDGDTKRIPLKEIKQYSEPKCLHCPDFSAELADISVGGVGLDGWTMTVIRTEKGREFFEQALKKGLLRVKKVSEFSSSLNLALKLSKMKRRRAGKK